MEGLLYFWSITRGGLWWEGSLNGGTITRGGLWWEGSLNGGTTVLTIIFAHQN